VGVEQHLTLARLLCVAAAAEFDAGAVGQDAQRVEEIDPVALDHEVDRVAAGLAAETVEKLLRGVDVKRRRLFLVERAESDETLAAALERHALSDEFHDVRGLENLRFKIACGAHVHLTSKRDKVHSIHDQTEFYATRS
jgi:hypothetical protein